MRCFPRLLHRNRYKPAIFDLTGNEHARRHWIKIFKLNLIDIERIVRENRDVHETERMRLAKEEFFAFLERMSACPDDKYRDVHAWSVHRDEVLVSHGIPDPYKELKEDENEKALDLLPSVMRRIGEIPKMRKRLREILLNIFAGNLFDLGSAVTAKAHREKGLEFESVLEGIRGKKWFIDDLDRFCSWVEEARGRGHAAILFLADNAGPDFLCGCLPFATELASFGVQASIALNEKPALNDVTYQEGLVLLDRVCDLVPSVDSLRRKGLIRLLSSGNNAAGIDLRQVSVEMAELSETIDLLVLEGQGRAVETNWNSKFDVDCLRISTIKDCEVARYLGAKTYDMLFRYTEAGSETR